MAESRSPSTERTCRGDHVARCRSCGHEQPAGVAGVGDDDDHVVVAAAEHEDRRRACRRHVDPSSTGAASTPSGLRLRRDAGGGWRRVGRSRRAAASWCAAASPAARRASASTALPQRVRAVDRAEAARRSRARASAVDVRSGRVAARCRRTRAPVAALVATLRRARRGRCSSSPTAAVRRRSRPRHRDRRRRATRPRPRCTARARAPSRRHAPRRARRRRAARSARGDERVAVSVVERGRPRDRVARRRERVRGARRRRACRRAVRARSAGVEAELAGGRVELAVELGARGARRRASAEQGCGRGRSWCSIGWTFRRWPPGSRGRSASAARPRAMRERTVPGGMPSTLGDLGVVHADEVAQRDRGAVTRRAASRARRRRRAGRRPRRRSPGRVAGRFGHDLDGRGRRLPPAGLVERGVRRDAVAPGREPRRARRTMWILRAIAISASCVASSASSALPRTRRQTACTRSTCARRSSASSAPRVTARGRGARDRRSLR